MKIIYLVTLLAVFAGSGNPLNLQAQKGDASVRFEAKTDKKIFFQSESDTIKGYREVKPGDVQHIESGEPGYYYYLDSRQQTHTVYLTPGSKTLIREKENGEVEFEGDNKAINEFLGKHAFLLKVPEGVAQFSPQWREYNEGRLREEQEALKNSSLPADFIAIHTTYLNCQNMRQLLSGPDFQRMFLRVEPELPADYYAFLKELKFDDPNLLYYPKWFTLMVDALERMEKEQFIPVSYKNCLAIYASRTQDPAVRSQFMIRYLEQQLKKGYTEEYPLFLEEARKQVQGTEGQKKLDQLEQSHLKMAQSYRAITRGAAAPSFSASDINGKEYHSSAFAGKVMVLDFWFSGCMPCKAEMPYMEKLAEEFRDYDIRFLSLSLDSDKPLVAMWKNLVKDKTDTTTLQLNVPGGFQSPLANHFGIRSVPRIVIVDQQGKIVDAFARRPSDPKLKDQLEELLWIQKPVALTRESCSRIMQQVMTTPGALEKERIMKDFSERVRLEKADFAYPMLNMMMFQVIKSLYEENHVELADQYVAGLGDSPYKRDLLFLTGNGCMENEQFDIARPLLEQAALLTLRLNEGKELTAEEREKYPLIFGFYAELLIKENQVEKAVPYASLAYEHSKNDFRVENSYLAVLIHQKRYKEAFPILEKFFRDGKASPQYGEWLKLAYKADRGSVKGFDSYLASLTSGYEHELKSELEKKMVCEKAPLFTLKNMEGKEVSLASLKGKVVVLDFWATWCGPCKASFPAMQKTAHKFADNQEVVFLFINTLDTKRNLEAEVKRYMEEKGYDFNVLFDPTDPATKECAVFNSFKSKGVPAKYIIDKNGDIRFKATGFSGSDEETIKELSAMIRMLL